MNRTPVIPGNLLVEQLADERMQWQATMAWWAGFAWGWIGATVFACGTMWLLLKC